MSDWKLDLENKFNTIKKEGGENYVRSNLSSGINSSRSGGLFVSKEIRKGVINVSLKGGKMITLEAALKDIDAIVAKTTDEGVKAVIKTLRILTKFISTMRSNQLLTEKDKEEIRKSKAERPAK